MTRPGPGPPRANHPARRRSPSLPDRSGRRHPFTEFHGNVPSSPIVFTMTQNVSVPEKTLEHWASLCIAYRYRSLAAQWWPVNGVDIDLQVLPAQPGKAIQLELKTITPVGPGRHRVKVDLGQLWEYSQKPLARQPFYAFPRPHWDGELAAAARADGQDVTELAVQRSKTGWWFADWMVVMTTRQVAGVLRQDLNAHRRRDRGVRRCLVQFDISDPGKPEWGDPGSSVPPSEVLDWSEFWSELDECGRDEWPQLIRVPRRGPRPLAETPASGRGRGAIPSRRARRDVPAVGAVARRVAGRRTGTRDARARWQRQLPGRAGLRRRHRRTRPLAMTTGPASRKIAGRWSSSAHAGYSLPNGNRLPPGGGRRLPVRNTGMVGASGKTASDQVGDMTLLLLPRRASRAVPRCCPAWLW